MVQIARFRMLRPKVHAIHPLAFAFSPYFGSYSYLFAKLSALLLVGRPSAFCASDKLRLEPFDLFQIELHPLQTHD